MAMLVTAVVVKTEADDVFLHAGPLFPAAEEAALSVKSEVDYGDGSAEDDVDHLSLKDRLRLLAVRPSGPSSAVESVGRIPVCHTEVVVKKESCFIEEVTSCDYHTMKAGLLVPETNNSQSSGFVNAEINMSQVNDATCLYQQSQQRTPAVGQKQVDADTGKELLHSASLFVPMQVKVENLEDGIIGSCTNVSYSFPNADVGAVKIKMEILDEGNGDLLDHVPLQERMKMLASSWGSSLNFSEGLTCLQQSVPYDHERDSVGVVDAKPNNLNAHQIKEELIKDLREKEHHACPEECDSIGSVNAKASCFRLQRKKKKTATDSVEIALEEDAPGLLQVLIDRGIKVDELNLYGNVEDKDSLDISNDEDGFAELETIITKLFSQPSTLFKLGPLKRIKGSRVTSYWLACLVSLIEQTRYLQFRKWPVEWGWCRELQSFIFIFEKHNRIVVERPEYGYATYFFKIVESLPINWQIKRLVTAMKLESFSRTTLIENRPLLVGEDLTAGEAKVLEEYGWIPNSGLGTMLHYCDRVVHNKKNEGDISEWRCKMGKLLMDGYDGGSVALLDLPKRLVDYAGGYQPKLKADTEIFYCK